MRRGIVALICIIAGAGVSGCLSMKKAERTVDPPSMTMELRWVASPDNDPQRSDPRSIFVALERRDTVRVIIRNNGGEQVAREHLSVLGPGTYRLVSSFTQLLQGSYFAEIRTGTDSFMRQFTVVR